MAKGTRGLVQTLVAAGAGWDWRGTSCSRAGRPCEDVVNDLLENEASVAAKGTGRSICS